MQNFSLNLEKLLLSEFLKIWKSFDRKGNNVFIIVSKCQKNFIVGQTEGNFSKQLQILEITKTGMISRSLYIKMISYISFLVCFSLKKVLERIS